MLYHHARLLTAVCFGEVEAIPRYSFPLFRDAYHWLEGEVGFYPLFLSVGSTLKDIRMTGYATNWQVRVGSRPKDRIARGKFPNIVLFSFEHVGGVFVDYMNWHIALNTNFEKGSTVTDYERRLILRPSWPHSKWLAYAKKFPHSVQLVVPRLTLTDAKRVWVRNRETKKILESGFQNVQVKRIPIIPFDY